MINDKKTLKPPHDHYGTALKAAIEHGSEYPELVAALHAQITEALEDILERTKTP